MSKFLEILKFQFKCSFGSKLKKANFNKSLKIQAIVLIILCCPVSILFGAMSYQNGLLIFQDIQILKFIIPSISFIAIFFINLFSLSTLFYNDSDKYLKGLPISSKEIFAARLVLTCLFNYLIEALFVLPIYIGYGVGANFAVDQYFNIFIYFLLFPIIPTILTSLVILLFSKLCDLRKNRIIYPIFVMITIFIIMLFVTPTINTTTDVNVSVEESLRILKESLDSYGNYSLLSYFPSIPVFVSLVGKNFGIRLLGTISSIGLNAILFYLTVVIFHKSYYNYVLNIKSERKKKENTSLSISDNAKKKITFIEIAKNDFKNIFRNSYYINYILELVVLPLAFLIIFLFQVSENDGNFMNNMHSMAALIDFSNPLVFSIIIGEILFIISLNSASAKSITRLDKDVKYIKTLPITTSNFVLGEALYGMLTTYLFLLIFLITFFIFGFYSVLQLLLLMLIAFCLTITLNLLGVLLNLYFPKPNYDRGILLSNLSTFIYEGVCWFLIALIILLGFISLKFCNENKSILLIVFMVLWILLNAFIIKKLFFNKNIYKNI